MRKSMLKLVRSQSKPQRWRGRLLRTQQLLQRGLVRFVQAFLEVFPPPDGPTPSGPTPPIAKSAALREGAQLAESLTLKGRKAS